LIWLVGATQSFSKMQKQRKSTETEH